MLSKLILLLALAVYCSFEPAAAQNLGINTTGSVANTSAALDVDFTNKGVLIPRVALSSLTDAVTVANPATSLLVYSKGGAIADGYYYNSGTSVAPIWSSFITTASTGNGCFTNWQLFTANGTFTVPAGITKIKVCVYGGGAGGGPKTIGPNYGGGGGGAGGYAEGIYTVIPLSNYTVIVGSGGNGGSGGALGTNGGTSSFGTLINASGGLAGTSRILGGFGGFGSGGYLNTSLGSGGSGSVGGNAGSNGTGGGGSGGGFESFAGGGGGGGFGGGNGGSNITPGTNALANTGGGGGGAPGGGADPGVNGGNGAAGKVIVFW